MKTNEGKDFLSFENHEPRNSGMLIKKLSYFAPNISFNGLYKFRYRKWFFYKAISICSLEDILNSNIRGKEYNRNMLSRFIIFHEL
ncbi:MAG: hypothetical protein ABIN25_06940, partial [Ginsengibacter sp.]